MLFNSLAFAVFFPIVFFIYWILPNKIRWVVILVSSYYFYMSWNPKYVVLIFGTTVISYISAIFIEKADNVKIKKLLLASSVTVCLMVLFIFKYLNFFLKTFYDTLSIISINIPHRMTSLLLPVGISFYTFQTLSYVIDVYKGKVSAENHFGYYAAFISFFPQLVAGPIERTENLLPQIKKTHTFNEAKAMDGVKLMLWGFFKKLVIADAVGKFVDVVYENIHMYEGGVLMAAIFLFTIEIYCDFSGYSSIAIGTAKLMDIDLMNNFHSPYFAVSLQDFWKRWHISLSTWFKDYVYIPLGGGKCGKLRHYINLLITFSLSGLWHGANWTYILWGCLHGSAQVIEKILDKPFQKLRRSKIGKVLCQIMVFIFCNIAWVFFRAKQLSDAVYVLANCFKGFLNLIQYCINAKNTMTEMDFGPYAWAYLAVCICIMAVVDFINYNDNIIRRIKSKNIIIQWGLFLLLAFITIIFAQKGEAAEFVYFQF